jgi:hypothetical protein
MPEAMRILAYHFNISPAIIKVNAFREQKLCSFMEGEDSFFRAETVFVKY